MRNKHLVPLLLGLALLVPAAGPARAQDGEVPDYVAVKAYLDRDAYHPGQDARIAIEFKIDPSVHVNANKTTEDYQYPTDVKWDAAPAGASLGAIEWPKPKMQAFEFTEGKKIAVLEGTQRAYLTVKIGKDVAPGTSLKLTGVFGAQGCTHSVCYAPQKDDLKVTIRVVAADEETTLVNEEKFAQPKRGDAGEAGAPAEGEATGHAAAVAPADGTPSAEAAAAEQGPEAALSAAATAAPSTTTLLDDDAEPVAVDCAGVAGKDKGPSQDTSLAMMFLLSFLGGLGLTFTPCVLPLVPITISFFSRQQSAGGRPVGMAALYVLGLALVYAALGTVAALSGGLFGAALQNTWVLVGIATLMVGLALSMFGLWDMNLPSSLTSRIGGGRSGNVGAFLMGGAMGIIAAPCVGPFVVSLLTYVARLGSELPRPQAVLAGGSLFFVLALGLGTPFFLVGLGIARVQPGQWMVTVKKIFGFVILGLAIWFLRSVVGNEIAQWLLVALLAAAAVVLMLPAMVEGATSAQRALLRGVAALSAVGAVVAALWTLGLVGAGHDEGRPWSAYTDGAVEQARLEGKPVVIDFMAEWCTVCKEIEHRTFPAPEVQDAFEDFALLRADLTDDTDPAVKALYKKYAIKGLPTIVFLDRNGRELEDLRLSKFEAADEFAARLKCASFVEVASR